MVGRASCSDMLMSSRSVSECSRVAASPAWPCPSDAAACAMERMRSIFSNSTSPHSMRSVSSRIDPSRRQSSSRAWRGKSCGRGARRGRKRRRVAASCGRRRADAERRGGEAARGGEGRRDLARDSSPPGRRTAPHWHPGSARWNIEMETQRVKAMRGAGSDRVRRAPRPLTGQRDEAVAAPPSAR